MPTFVKGYAKAGKTVKSYFRRGRISSRLSLGMPKSTGYAKKGTAKVTPQRGLAAHNNISWSLMYGPKRSSKRVGQLKNLQHKLKESYSGR